MSKWAHQRVDDVALINYQTSFLFRGRIAAWQCLRCACAHLNVCVSSPSWPWRSWCGHGGLCKQCHHYRDPIHPVPRNPHYEDPTVVPDQSPNHSIAHKTCCILQDSFLISWVPVIRQQPAQLRANSPASSSWNSSSFVRVLWRAYASFEPVRLVKLKEMDAKGWQQELGKPLSVLQIISFIIFFSVLASSHAHTQSTIAMALLMSNIPWIRLIYKINHHNRAQLNQSIVFLGCTFQGEPVKPCQSSLILCNC